MIHLTIYYCRKMISIRNMLKLVVLLFCVLLNETYGAQAIQKPVSKPPGLADQEGCYDVQLNKVLPYEVPYNTDKCSRHICKENGDIIIDTCGVIYVQAGQTLVKGNQALPYPNCCDSVDMS